MKRSTKFKGHVRGSFTTKLTSAFKKKDILFSSLIGDKLQVTSSIKMNEMNQEEVKIVVEEYNDQLGKFLPIKDLTFKES